MPPSTFSSLPTADPETEEGPITTSKPCKYKARSRMALRLIEVLSVYMGPVLLTLAFILLSLTIFCYFSVFIPFHYPSEEEESDTSWTLGYIIQMTWSLYVIWGILANYYFAITTPPGSVLGKASIIDHDNASIQDVLLEMDSFTELPPICKRCNLPKPERTHHCSVCKRCVLKYDHHCPWIHNCVGHFNHRYFVMFMTYLFIASLHYVSMGVGPIMLVADEETPWPYWLDKSLVAFSMVVVAVFGIAVGGMGGWHWHLTLTAQTTLEQYNNNFMKSVCDKKGDNFHNMYDFGAVRNLQDFFNIGARGHYSWYTALLPLRIPPIGNGKKFEKSGRGFVLAYNDDDDIV
ncbi:hypothetical protein BGZ93_006455 [Podila epicladia]|nr:hypothetical protein BGZ92_007408 [Podila epicladia]KAG0094995.1 hypothetical protein BGZ93_006455 [Podila epicladia]